MKATLVKLNKKLIDLPPGVPFYYEIETEGLLPRVAKVGEAPPEVNVTERATRYDIMQVRNPDNQIEYLLVQLDDNNLFQKLFAITDERIATLKRKMWDGGRDEGFSVGRREERAKWHEKGFWWRIKFAFMALKFKKNI